MRYQAILNLTMHTGFLRAPFSSMHLALDSDISTLTIKKYQVELYTFGEFYESVIFLKAAISIKNWHQDPRPGYTSTQPPHFKKIISASQRFLVGNEMEKKIIEKCKIWEWYCFDFFDMQLCSLMELQGFPKIVFLVFF